MKVFADPCFHQADICFPGNNSGPQPDTSSRFGRALSRVSCGYHLFLTTFFLITCSKDLGGPRRHFWPHVPSWASILPAAREYKVDCQQSSLCLGSGLLVCSLGDGKWLLRAMVLQSRLQSLLISNPRGREFITVLLCIDLALFRKLLIIIEIKAVIFLCFLFSLWH